MTLDLYHRLRPNVVCKARGSLCLFFIPETLGWLITDPVGARVLETLRTPRTLSQVAQEIAAQRGYDVRAVYDEVFRLVESAINVGLVEPSQDLSPKESPVAHGDALHPSFLYLHLTSRCNLRCTYCYALPQKGGECEGEDLPFAVALEVLRQAKEIGVEDVIFTGGEPLCHPQAVEVLRRAKRLGLRVNLLTNGVLLNPDLARKLAPNCHQITVSLDSVNPALHDLHRGRGSHARAVKAITILKEIGFPHVVAASVLTRHNQDERYEEFAAYAKSLGAERVSRQIYILQGDHRDERLSLDFVRFLRCLELKLEEEVAQGIPSGERPNLAWRDRCGAAFGVIAVGADGMVYPCQGLMRPEFSAGTVLEEPLGEIYANAGILRRIRAITVADIPGCNSCEYRFLCGGGCRALAYNTAGSISAPIPPDYCAVSRLLAEWKLWAAGMHALASPPPAELSPKPFSSGPPSQ